MIYFHLFYIWPPPTVIRIFQASNLRNRTLKKLIVSNQLRSKTNFDQSTENHKQPGAYSTNNEDEEPLEQNNPRAVTGKRTYAEATKFGPTYFNVFLGCYI